MSDVRSIPFTPETRRRDGRHMPLLVWQIERLAKKIACGSITAVLPNGRRIMHKGPQPGPSAKLVIRRWRALWRLMVGGELAFAESFFDGDWWTPDLLALLDLGARNERALQDSITGVVTQRWISRFKHWARRNTKRGSKRNIAAHYDLGNAFYAHWLDRGMNYSSAVFARPDETLEAAQNRKLDRIVELLDVFGGEKVLEIGCGWGALMERLLPQCDVTGITLSAEQLAFARQRVRAEDPGSRADLRLQDYRDVDGAYDRIVSIEMIEAVGERYWPVYFAKLNQSLTGDGVVLLQAITINEDRAVGYRTQPDFIQRYIFPGGVLPTIETIRREAANAGLELVSHELFGQSYARTLALWRENFLAKWPAIAPLGFDAAFKRMWEYYLSYCEVGFRSGAIDVGFYKLVKRAN